MLTARVDDGHVDIDLSLKNVLAVLNTKLLKCYSFCTLAVPMVRVLKRIVKAFDVNNPAKGSLSSYGQSRLK